MSVERWLSVVGDTGRYHWIILPLFSLTWLALVFNNVVMTFYGYAPAQSPASCWEGGSWPAGASNSTARVAAGTSSGTGASFHPCNVSNESTPESSVVHVSSIVTEWQLYGDRKWMVSLATSMYFAGVMVGGLVMGSLADAFGRKKVLLACLIAPAPLGVATFFNPYYEGFVALRFCLGIFVQGLSGVGFVNCVEFFTAKRKLRVILGFEVVWVGGMMLLALLAFLLPNWRHLQLAVALLPAALLFYAWWLPESPRWLFVKKRHAELGAIVARVARINRVKLDQAELTGDSEQAVLKAAAGVRRHFTVIDMVRTTLIRRRSLVLFYVWFTVSVGYYALTFGLPPLLPNRYLNFFLNATCEMVGLGINALAVAKIGRRIPLIVSMVSSGVICAASGLLASNVESSEVMSGVTTSMVLIGRTFVTVSYQTLFIWTSELFPTVIRSLAVGACGFWMRLGSLVAPQLLLLGYYTWQDLPILIIGGMCLVGGGLTFLLPETKDKVLLDSIEEVEGSKAKDDLSPTLGRRLVADAVSKL